MNFLNKKSLLMVAAFTLNSVAGLATTSITQCGTVISQPGHYELANSLLCVNDATKPAITVKNTKHVTIHMKNRSIAFILKKLPILIFPPRFEAPKAIGILVQDSKDVEIEGDGGLASIMRAASGVLARNSEKVEVEKVALKNSKVGVSFQGPNSQDGKVDKATFSQNQCDIQIKLGAESPEVEDSSVGSYCS